MAEAQLSFPIRNATMGLIFARGQWSEGIPMKHNDSQAGVRPIAFYPDTPPSPPPPPPPPSRKQAGVWPLRWEGNFTMAMAPFGAHLALNWTGRLRYDSPSGQQLLEYFLLSGPQTGELFYSELWVGHTLYKWGVGVPCFGTSLSIGILRPDWLQSASYFHTNYLLRQRNGWSDYTLCDLYLEPAPVGGMTNSWVVVNSSLAEPVRLEGPVNFDPAHPIMGIFEFMSFRPVSEFDPAVFRVPTQCKNATLTGHPMEPIVPNGLFGTLASAGVRAVASARRRL